MTRKTWKDLSVEGGIGFSVLFVALVLAVLAYFDLDQQVARLFAWLDTIGIWGPLLFILIEIFVVVLLVPGIMFTMGAGFLFGVGIGSLCVVIGTTLGAGCAFIVARYLLGGRAARYLLSHPRLNRVDDAFAQEGWKMILLTRCIPFFPFKLSNYFFGLTRFRLRDFLLGTVLGIVPITLTNVYLGSLAADLSTLGLTTTGRSGPQWLVYGLGFAVSIFAVIFLTRRAKQALRPFGMLDTHHEQGT